MSRVDKNFAARLLGLLSEGARVLAQVVSHWTDGSYRPLDQRGPVASMTMGSVVLKRDRLSCGDRLLTRLQVDVEAEERAWERI